MTAAESGHIRKTLGAPAYNPPDGADYISALRKLATHAFPGQIVDAFDLTKAPTAAAHPNRPGAGRRDAQVIGHCRITIPSL